MSNFLMRYSIRSDNLSHSTPSGILLRYGIQHCSTAARVSDSTGVTARVLAVGDSDETEQAHALMTELGREGLSLVTQQSWLSRALAYLRDLQLADDSGLTILGRSFAMSILAEEARVARDPLTDRGGFEAPKVSHYKIGTRRRRSEKQGPDIDREAWRQSQERRNDAHAELLDAVAEQAKRANLQHDQTQYIDLLVGNIIIEVKSLEDDDIAQARAALAQLYHYKFIHRRIVSDPLLLAVISRKPAPNSEVTEFLESCDIRVAWREDGRFTLAHPSRESAIAWLTNNLESDHRIKHEIAAS